MGLSARKCRAVIPAAKAAFFLRSKFASTEADPAKLTKRETIGRSRRGAVVDHFTDFAEAAALVEMHGGGVLRLDLNEKVFEEGARADFQSAAHHRASHTLAAEGRGDVEMGDDAGFAGG